jgi:hypothetical protein
MHRLSPIRANVSVGMLPGHARAYGVCALLLLTLQLSSGGCIWIDDFGKFKIGDAGERDIPDAQTGRPQTDAAADASCDAVDCKVFDGECSIGMCNPATGRCEALPKSDGTVCFDSNPCTFNDRCSKGICTGEGLDCSALNDDCSDGVCDPETGGCTFGPNVTSQSCDDLNACTIDDRCTDDPEQRCLGDNAPAGAKCTDFSSCTGTAAEPDACNDDGRCESGAPLAVGTDCNDETECTASDKCDENGECHGTPDREGAACQQPCSSNTICRKGACVPYVEGTAPEYNKQCLSSFCGLGDICQDKWKTDLTCQCGCGYEDSACSACSPYMCQNHADHSAARWCDKAGKLADNCPDSLKDDGKCDCGCQFDDPDCNGGTCCSGTGKKGCNDSYVEECVCQRTPNGDRSCCDTEWTDRCAQLAVNLGCMLCPAR